MKNPYHRTHRHAFALLLALSSFFLLPFSFSQQVSQPEVDELATSGTLTTTATTAPIPVVTSTTTEPAKPSDEEVITMSPFEVNSEKDEGYAAVNTTSGSRLNTPLRDTPSAIQPFTQEFLDDVGANTIEDMLSYAGNVEAETEDSTAAFNNNSTRMAGNSDNAFRIRGIAANVSLDYTESGVPMDLYNIDRAEISSGANSILFGMGSQGGLLSLTSASANMQRNTTRIQLVTGTFIDPTNSWNFWRTNLNYNVVLMPRKFALRVTGVMVDGDSNRSWQNNIFNHTRRINPMITFKPFKNTRVRMSYERGKQENSTTRAWNASDGLSAWLDYAALYGYRPLLNSFADGQGFPGNSYNPAQHQMTYPSFNVNAAPYSVNIFRNLRVPANNNYTLFPDGTVYNVRQSWRTNNRWPAGMNNREEIRLPPSLSSYYYNTVGPSGIRTQRFERWNVNVDQDIGKFHFELAYNHNKVEASAHSPHAGDAQLNGDPNSFYSAMQWVDNTPSSVIPNPYAGRLYLQSQWIENFHNERNDAIRLSSEYSFNLRQYGRYRMVGFLEYTKNETYNNVLDEILVDQNQRAINNANTPNGDQNMLTRRQYVTEGDFNTYYDGDWRIPATNFVIGDKTYHSTYITRASETPVHTKRNITSAMLTLQGYLFNDRLVFTAGGRYDTLTHQRENTSRIIDADDPRILNKSKVWNEWDLSGVWRPVRSVHPYTFSAGAVWHATDRLSTFVNYSTNMARPSDDRTVLPTGDVPDPARGRTLDIGFMYDITPGLNIRFTKYKTQQLGDARIGNTNAANNASLGSQNLFDIYDALFFLTPTAYSGGAPVTVKGDPYAGWIEGTGAYKDSETGQIRGMGPMPYDMYAITKPDPRNPDTFPFGAPPRYNSGTVDVISEGYEATVTANVTKAFTLIFNFSYTNRYRERLFPEIFAYYNKMIPIWMAMADPAKNGGITYNVVIPNDAGTAAAQTVPLYDYIRLQLYAPDAGMIPGEGDGFTSVRSGLNQQLVDQSGALGSRPFKFRVTARYAIRKGFLRGLAFGGSIRWSSYNLMARPSQDIIIYDMPPEGATDLQIDPGAYMDTKVMVKGQAQYNGNAFITYKCKFFGGRTDARFQLNIDNIFNNSIITVGQLNNYGAIRRIYSNQPRRIQFTTTFDW